MTQAVAECETAPPTSRKERECILWLNLAVLLMRLHRWGKLAKVNSGPASEAARGLRLEECVNFECGVVIPRHVLLDLLEPGSSWEDIVPYHRPAQPYEYVVKSPQRWQS